MKAFLMGLSLLTSFSTFAYDYPTVDYRVVTYDYSTKYYPGHADKIGLDTACAYSVLSHDIFDKDVKVIRLEAVNAGMFVEMQIPKNRLPLKNGDTFITGTSLSQNVVTYNNGVLTQKLLNPSKSLLVNQTTGALIVDANLRNPRLAQLNYIGSTKSQTGKVSWINIMVIKCAF